MKRRVVVTGIGALTPIGNNVNDTWKGILNHQCGIDLIQSFDTSNMKVKVAGELKNFEATEYLDKKDVRKMDKFIQYGLIAAKEAIKDSKLEIDSINHDRFGVVVSSGIGGLGSIEENHQRGLKKGFDRVSPYFIPMTIVNLAAGQIAIAFKAQGLATCPVTACAGGTNAIGDAFRNIRDGYLDVTIAGGCEASITPLGIGGFTSMHALSKAEDVNRASIPFDKERSGFVMGEGAGVLILEEYEHALKRGAKIYCEIAGYGSTCDANHVTAPLEDGSMAAQAMTEAVKDAGIKPENIDYINAHGTSTKLNDKGETNAIKKAFGEHAYKLAVSSTKSMTGHMLGASGAVEAIISALAVKNDIIPPTINYQVPDDDCDLDIVPNKARESRVDYAMSNSLGFGGHNASIVLRKVV